MKYFRTFAALASASATAIALAGPAASAASPTPEAGADAKAIAAFTERFKTQHPGTAVDAVRTAPIPGVFEVAMGKNVAYVDATGRYALFGHLWDMQDQRDLTADRKATLDRVDVRSLPLQHALHRTAGKGSRTLYVFADPQCGYCKQLEKTLAEVDDVTVHTFVVPILGDESKRLATAIACAEDPNAAWAAWMRDGVQPPAPPAGCTPPTAEIERAARSMGVVATPTLIAADGRRNAGALPAARVTAWLNEANKPQSADAGITVKTAAR